jgi:arylsulfatase A-like enzyme
LIDLNPTLCEWAGLPQQENIDVRSYVSVLRDKQRDHRPETVGAIRNWRCIHNRRYKLIQNDNDLTELYDLEQDPHEIENIASQRPALVRDLAAVLRARFLEAKWLR